MVPSPTFCMASRGLHTPRPLRHVVDQRLATAQLFANGVRGRASACKWSRRVPELVVERAHHHDVQERRQSDATVTIHRGYRRSVLREGVRRARPAAGRSGASHVPADLTGGAPGLAYRHRQDQQDAGLPHQQRGRSTCRRFRTTTTTETGAEPPDGRNWSSYRHG